MKIKELAKCPSDTNLNAHNNPDTSYSQKKRKKEGYIKLNHHLCLVLFSGPVLCNAWEQALGPIPGIENQVASDASNEAIGDGIRQGHQEHGEECGNGLSHIPPFHFPRGPHHHHPHSHQRRPHRPRRYRRQQRRHEKGRPEVGCSGQRREPRASPLPYPRRRLYESRHGRRPQQRPHHDGRRVSHESKVLPLEISVAVRESRETRHRAQCPRRVQYVHVQKRGHRLPESPPPHPREAQRSRRGLDLVRVHYSLEISVRGVPGRSLGERRHGGVPEPGDGGDEDDAVYDGALHFFYQTVGYEDEASDAEPEGGAAHRPVQAEDVIRDTAAGDEGDGAVGECNDGCHGCTRGAGAAAEGDLGTKADNRDEEEDEAFHKDHSEGLPVGEVAGAVEADHGVGKVGVGAHPGGKGEGEVGEHSHDHAADYGGCGRGHDEVAFGGLEARGVARVDGREFAGGGGGDEGEVARAAVRGGEQWVGAYGGAVGDGAGAAGVGEDGGVDGKDVGHGEERGGASTELCGEGALALGQLEASPDAAGSDVGVEAVILCFSNGKSSIIISRTE
ncbi:hypothetical protein STAS_16649 [Striga asiatica]|uniref:Uncharacterized protein n=1 Tax=Striga asiatica TaxID=4170 RepID=A0A5A7Q498_STRAF|nr:hypothetical protein STAS_16649 [Striga asiatica]